MTIYQDIAGPQGLPEDERIQLIGHYAVDHKKLVAFIVEDHAKANRYIKKLLQQFPTIVIIDRTPGPLVGKTITVRVGPPKEGEA